MIYWRADQKNNLTGPVFVVMTIFTAESKPFIDLATMAYSIFEPSIIIPAVFNSSFIQDL